VAKKSSKEARQYRKDRIRKKVAGTPDRLRLSVYRGNTNIYSQIIDDTKGVTLVAASSQSPEVKGKVKGFTVETAKMVGELLAQKAKAAGIENVVFDRGGYRYHGKIKALSEGARSGGLKF